MPRIRWTSAEAVTRTAPSPEGHEHRAGKVWPVSAAYRIACGVAALLLAGCSSGAGSATTRPASPTGTEQQQHNSRMAGYGPCIEEHRDAAGNISVADMEKCVELHLD
jgi:hypothetical protein